jgi:hypothetical protein
MNNQVNVFAGGSAEPVEVELWQLYGGIEYLEIATASGLMLVKDFLPEVRKEILVDTTGQYNILGEHLDTHGQTVPLFISKDKARLRDGIHRVAIATILGWRAMTVSTTRIVYSSWDSSEQGKRYHKLWQERLEGLKNGTP